MAKPQNPLEKKLEEFGLEPKYWASKLKNFNIENINQLKHADKMVLGGLIGNIRHSWEKGALEILLDHIKKCSQDERQQKQEYIEKNDKSIKELIKKIEDATNEKGRTEKIKIDFQIPPGQKNMHQELLKIEQLTKELADRVQLNASAIVRRISAGQILRGYHLKEEDLKRVIPRKQLITIPDQIELMAPRMQETFMSQEFFDEKKSGQHDHVVHHWGIHAGIFGLIGCFAPNIGLSTTHADDTLGREQSNTGFTEIKETIIVPTASFSLENTHCYLSPEAINELIKIDEYLEKDPKGSARCKDFFDAFGSHYFAGTYHFGGRLTRSAICRSANSITKSDSIKLAKQAFRGENFALINLFLTGSIDNINDKSISTYKENEDYRLNKKLVKCGGPAEADSIQQWKFGLVKYPSTWSIIHLDVHKDEWRGVWELLTDELSSKFKDIKRLRRTLQNYYDGYTKMVES